MDLLQEILTNKRREVEKAQSIHPVETLRTRETEMRDFYDILARDGMSIIAEIKRKSPSRGVISLESDLVEIARQYEANGARAISVLTDGKYFSGSLNFLREIRARVALPILRKDFILSDYQIWESYHAGADAILLILDVLTGAEAVHLYNLAMNLGLGVLVETHSEKSLEKLPLINPAIVGVNSRDLQSMEIEFDRMIRLVNQVPDESIKVAESGIIDSSHLQRAVHAGFDAALIGTALMESENPGQALRQLLDGVKR